ncbi:MAG: GH3 auxin-responsive promoter family protein [Chitinophagales bacterium]|nr:GH3 auxin-responsive promoter family protein [Chitinophagales bacterium]MDW8392880.1 GH3 auxin-responsive promoter family protein [Chitinophagales bacterium]
MPLLGQLIKRTIALNSLIQQGKEKLVVQTPADRQRRQLKSLLRRAAYTRFGLHYRFSDILRSDQLQEAFRSHVPVFDYNKIFTEWWQSVLAGESNVCWPGTVRYFALSSGTSEASSKRIPLTPEMIRAIKRGSIKQILSSASYNLPASVYEKKILMIGGSTSLSRRGHYYEGDLSGISASKIPLWFHVFYKPGRKLARERNWDRKLNEIARRAPEWDVSIIVGIPAWIQILLERIIALQGARHIHDVWPNLDVYVHSGVSFEPYRKGFERLLGRPIITQNSYLASEGFIAFDTHPNPSGMEMLLANGIYFEFIPFDEQNFDAEGNLQPYARALHIGEVVEGKDYALLLSTCAGAWRYLIGDVIQFTDLSRSEIKITGRTRHFLNLTGEHLSVDNMNRAIETVGRTFGIDIREFTVAGVPYEGLFAHQWWIGTDKAVDPEQVKKVLDEQLCVLNDDYATERSAALKDVLVTMLPNKVFVGWMASKGKMGGQHKFPRVLRNKQLDDWQQYLREQGYS